MFSEELAFGAPPGFSINNTLKSMSPNQAGATILEREVQSEIVDAKRHTGVLTEGLRHELQLVAERFQLHLDRHHADDRAYLDEQFREPRALILLHSSAG